MAEYKCGDCFHAELCEKSEMLVGFSRDNPAYCGMFLNSADVTQVRHGRWVLDEYARYFRCSACGTQFDDETDTYCNIMNGFAPNYCEDCGAKMDGGAE